MRPTALVHNPLLRLPSAARLRDLPHEAQEALVAVLGDLRRESADKAEQEWRRNKGMTAAYWKAVSIYCLHLIRAVRPAKRRAA